tara:strand:- start:5 stop:388 length:384 start_codon:yes stop_codon:yes gene_type:complete
MTNFIIGTLPIETLTKKENAVLAALITNLNAEPGFSDCEAWQVRNTYVDQNGAIENADQVIGGVLGSLENKGYIEFVDGTVNDEDDYRLVCLTREYWHLNPAWWDDDISDYSLRMLRLQVEKLPDST